MEDRIAKRCRDLVEDADKPHRNICFGDKGWSKSIRGIKWSRLNKEELYKGIISNDTIGYWLEWETTDYKLEDKINWSNLQNAFKSASYATQRRVSCFSTKHLPCKKR